MKKKITIAIFLSVILVLFSLFVNSNYNVSFADEIRNADQLVDIARNEKEAAKVIGTLIGIFVLGFIVGKVSS